MPRRGDDETQEAVVSAGDEIDEGQRGRARVTLYRYQMMTRRRRARVVLSSLQRVLYLVVPLIFCSHLIVRADVVYLVESALCSITFCSSTRLDRRHDGAA
jgi:hypothetical protein